MLAERADELEGSPGAAVDRTRGALSLRKWAVLAAQPFAPAAHHLLLLDELEGLADGRGDRLLVLMPPGSAKSYYTSILFPAWWYHRHPADSIIATCHTDALAQYFARRARATLTQHADDLAVELRREDRSSGSWRLKSGGEYLATGVRGPIVGRRADLIIVDDPVKGHAEAGSASSRETLWRWFQSDLLTRLKPRGRIVMVMTRWHEDDLAGRLLQSGDGWRTLRLPALAELDDPLGRRPGEALWPSWENVEALNRRRRALGERVWAALYQQSPRPDAETLFRVSHLRTVDAAPAMEQVVRAWDLASTEAGAGRDPDWTVGLKLGRTHDGTYYVLDVIRFQGAPLAVERAIVAAAEQDGRDVAIGLPQDPGQAGKQQVCYLTSKLAGWRVHAGPETGSKVVRAGPVSAQIDAGVVAVMQAPWTRALTNELRDFPHGSKDDQVDALSRAFMMLTQATSPRLLRFDLMAR